MATTQNIVNGRSGTVINKVRTTSFTQTSTTQEVIITSAPTTSTMTLLCSLTITPESSSNVLLFNFCGSFDFGQTTAAIVSLFQGTTLLTTYWNPGFGGSLSPCPFSMGLIYQQAAGTTSSTTYSIYYAFTDTTGTGGPTVYSNSFYSGAFSLGNSLSYTFTITEEIA